MNPNRILVGCAVKENNVEYTNLGASSGQSTSKVWRASLIVALGIEAVTARALPLKIFEASIDIKIRVVEIACIFGEAAACG